MNSFVTHITVVEKEEREMQTDREREEKEE